MFLLYGAARFYIEMLRDDNPFEFDGLTVSQNLSIVMMVIGMAGIVISSRMQRDN